MSEQAISFLDKSSWGDGPWQSEPDRVFWEDPVTGLQCLIRRSTSGVWCGYVAVNKGHPFYGIQYNHTEFVVHGDLTYSDFCQEENKEEGICHVTEDNDVAWWFGFDCAHAGDYAPAFKSHFPLIYESPNDYKDIKYVKNQVKWLARQLNWSMV